MQEGRIRAAGTVALVAPQLEQRGEIEAPRIGLAAAERVSVDVEGDGLIFFNLGTDQLDTRLQVLGRLKADGGLAEVRAQARAGFADTVLNLEGVVQARGLALRNGRIVVDGGSAGITDVRGTLDASGSAPGARGGEVTVLGDKVGLFDRAAIDASGPAGGGQVLVGGNYQGQGPERNSSALYVAPGATVAADAQQAGDGGRVILWSDRSTRFYGSLSAQGGPQGGNGGFAEVSGKDFLDFAGTARLGAPGGAAGLLLLDPTDLTISNAVDSGVTAASPFSPTANGSNLSWATLNTNLAGSTAVTVTTVGSANVGAQDGTIQVTAVPAALQGSGTLTIRAAGDILVTAAGSIARTGTGSVVLNADKQVRLAGPVSMNAGGGNLEITAGTQGVAFDAAVSVPAGSLTVNSAGAVTQIGALTVAGASAVTARVRSRSVAAPAAPRRRWTTRATTSWAH